jgi:prepilin signal peptidase PulO-like enzyme (type II secretory pathway)
MLNLFFGLFSFVLGTICGSFLNCVIYRLEVSKSFLKGRSYCPHCKHILDWRDLIPIFSFFILRGKCRYCHKPISLQYPLVELATGLLFVFTTYNLQPITYNLKILLNLGYQLLVVSCLVIIFVYDLKHYIIPDKVIYPVIAITFIYQLFRSLEFGILRSILSAVLASGFFLTIVLLSKGKWMGVGDIKLAFLMGLFLGWPKIIVALFSAFLIGALIGLILIALGKKTLKSEIPFGPFLVSGTFLALFFGQKILNWYLSLFLLK